MENEIIPSTDTGGDLSDTQMDSLLEGSNGTEGKEIPMTAADAAAPASDSTKTATAPAQSAVSEIIINYNGKEIKVPANDPRVTQWARQGYDYNQRMADYHKREAQLQKTAQASKDIEDRYKTIDEFVRTPEGQNWWSHVSQSWESRQAQGADPNNPLSRDLEMVKRELNDIKQFKQQLSEQRTLEIQHQEDSQLASEIENIQKAYPNLDLSAQDADGKSLEFRVLEHAHKNGINSFRAAFRDFNHDQLVKLEAERAKESLAQDLQKQKSLGILGKSPTSKKGLSAVENIKNKSYDQLLSEGMSELGIG